MSVRNSSPVAMEMSKLCLQGFIPVLHNIVIHGIFRYYSWHLSLKVLNYVAIRSTMLSIHIINLHFSSIQNAGNNDNDSSNYIHHVDNSM